MNSLENVKVGDLLLINDRWGENVAVVERLTTTLIVTGDGYRINRKNGCVHGDSQWNHMSVRIASQEDADRVRHRRYRVEMINKCGNICFSNLSDSQLEQILEIANQKQ